jgi:hypothetical protein
MRATIEQDSDGILRAIEMKSTSKIYLLEFSFGLAWVMGVIEIASSNLHMSAIKIEHF